MVNQIMHDFRRASPDATPRTSVSNLTRHASPLTFRREQTFSSTPTPGGLRTQKHQSGIGPPTQPMHSTTSPHKMGMSHKIGTS